MKVFSNDQLFNLIRHRISDIIIENDDIVKQITIKLKM